MHIMKSQQLPLCIYGRWRDRRTVTPPGSSCPIPVHIYSSPIPIKTPIVLGSHLQLIALAPSSYRTLLPPLYANEYDVYDPAVVGTVAGAQMLDGERMVFAVLNERKECAVGMVVIIAPFIDGFSRRPEDDDCPRAWMRKVLLGVRSQVALQQSAVVRDHLGAGETPARQLQYPDPREFYHDSHPPTALEPPHVAWRPWTV